MICAHTIDRLRHADGELAPRFRSGCERDVRVPALVAAEEGRVLVPGHPFGFTGSDLFEVGIETQFAANGQGDVICRLASSPDRAHHSHVGVEILTPEAFRQRHRLTVPEGREPSARGHPLDGALDVADGLPVANDEQSGHERRAGVMVTRR